MRWRVHLDVYVDADSEDEANQWVRVALHNANENDYVGADYYIDWTEELPSDEDEEEEEEEERVLVEDDYNV